MRSRGAVAAFAASLLALGGCSGEPRRPDVLLVSIEGLDWSSTALEGGPVATPRLSALASDATLFQGLVSPTPDAAPAALTLLSGLPPSEHRLRRLDGAPEALRVRTLGDLFGSGGWRAGAFSQAPLFGGLTDVASGFEAWMMPSVAVPLGLPAMAESERPRTIAAFAQHWLRGLPPFEPAFAWLHFEAPARPGATALDAASRVAELDGLIGTLVDQLESRAVATGSRPVVVVTSLSTRGADAGAALDAGFVLDESVLRVRAIARVPGLIAGKVAGLSGLDEIHELLAGVVEPGRPSRLRDLAAGQAVAREAVLVETQLPMTSLGAKPLFRALRPEGVASPEPDPLVMQALAADPGWPGGFPGPTAASVLPEWRELRAALLELVQGDAEAARRRLEPLVAEAGDRARAASFLLALSEAAAGRSDTASAMLRSLAESVPVGDPAHRQAVLALAEVQRGAGRAQDSRVVLQALSERHPKDLTALLQLGLACEQAGDAAASLETLSRALASRPTDARVLMAVASVHASRGRPDLAAAALGDALLQRPVDGELLLLASDASLEAGDYWTALTRINRYQEILGESADTMHRLGLVYHRGQRWASAVTFHGRALDQDDGHEPARLSLADALLRSGYEDDGQAILAVARARDPESGGACRVLVAFLLDAGREVEGRAELDRCLLGHPADAALRGLSDTIQGS